MSSVARGMIESAERYLNEARRLRVRSLAVDVLGEGGAQRVVLQGDRLRCGCATYADHGVCAHVLAVRDVFRRYLPEHGHRLASVETPDARSAVAP
jgi:hypothetical protein